MTSDPCARHQTVEASHVAMVATTTGRVVYRLCEACAANYPTASRLPLRVDVRPRKRAA